MKIFYCIWTGYILFSHKLLGFFFQKSRFSCQELASINSVSKCRLFSCAIFWLIFLQGMLKACGRPLLDCVFGGTLLQTVKCNKCSHLSCIYEEFLDLSIPIPTISTTSKIFNGYALKLRKSPSSTMSKHQKKKEKAIAKKVLYMFFFLTLFRMNRWFFSYMEKCYAI